MTALVEALRADGGAISVDYRSGPAAGQLVADAVFFAVGWPANVSQLALDAAGVRSGPGVIPVDDYLRTSAGHIFAAGDVNGRSMLVQTARMEGRIAASNAVLGPTRRATYDVVPSGSFTDPEYGRVGLTETQAAAHHDVVGIARYDDLLRPVADGRSEGFCKLIADRQAHTILGAHVLGEYSADGADRRRVHGRRDDGRAGRRAPAGLPYLHRGGQHGCADDLPVARYRALPASLELPRIRRLTSPGWSGGS